MTIKTTDRSDEENVVERGEAAEIKVPGESSQLSFYHDAGELEIVVKPSATAATTCSAATTNDNLEEAILPSTCYCPITKQIMVDPVVHPDGDSYEKSAVVERGGEQELLNFYPNRALKSYIERELERYEEAGSARGALRKIDDSLRQGWEKIAEKTGLGESRPLPDEFYCTLTLDLCHEPVIDQDGYTYEREAIVHWVRNNGDSPVTRKPTSVDQLYDNNAILNILLEESEKPEDLMHPCIRRWKEELSSPQPSIVPADASGENDTAVNNGRSSMNGPTSGDQRMQAHYPTTHEEIEDRMRQEHRRSMLGLLLILVVVAFALVYLPFYLVVFALAFCSCLYARRRLHERHIERRNARRL